MTTSSTLGSLLGAALLAAACAQPPAPEPAPRPQPPPRPAAPAPAAEEEEAPVGRDLTQLVVCDLVPGEEVAALMGGVLFAEPSPTASGTLWNECAYLVRPGAQASEALLATVRLYAPEHFGLAKGLAEAPTDVPGLADEAFQTEERPLFVVMALQRDDVALEVRVESSADDARALAELVFDRLVAGPPA
jgi:hypothetical protein